MNRIRSWVRSYFGFSRTETNGFLLLLPIMALLLFSEPVYRWYSINYIVRAPDETKTLDSLIASWKWKQPPDDTAAHSIPASLFKFDPNTASRETLLSLGLPEKLAGRIIHYRSRGGKFRIKADFKKVYGMDSLLAAQLYPFIDLPVRRPDLVRAFTKDSPKKNATRVELIDLNQADTAALIRIYGIGSRLARRITSYRSRLGGFVSMEQLPEVYGLDSAVIRELKKRTFIDSGFIPRKININRADKKELTALPYIKFNLANAITAYRFQHGDFTEIGDLKQIVLVNDPIFQKIKPYLTVKD